MHHITCGEYSINYNSDFSGDIHIRKDELFVKLPMELFEDLVAEKARMQMITALENADNETILYGKNHENNAI